MLRQRNANEIADKGQAILIGFPGLSVLCNNHLQ